METLDFYKNDWVKESGAKRKDLNHLTNVNFEWYQFLLKNNFCLEQEKVILCWVRAGLKPLLS